MAELLRPGRGHETRIVLGKPGIGEPLVKSPAEWPNCAGEPSSIKPVPEPKEICKAKPNAKSKPRKERIARAYRKPPNGTEADTYTPAKPEE